MNTPSPPDGLFLTDEGRRLIEERVAGRESRLAELHDALDGDARTDELVTASLRTAREIDELRVALDNAAPIESIPDDPRIVKLGDTVELRLDDATIEQYVIVQPREAVVDDRRVSIDSPLARALLGKRVGARVEIPAPRGAYACTILRADRRDAATGRSCHGQRGRR